MVCALYTLMKKFRDKKIYIWDVSRESMGVFIKLAFMKIDVQGFVTVYEEYVGERYMNRPIIAVRQIERDENSIIVASDEVTEKIISMLPEGKIIYLSKALIIDEELRQKRVIVYGTGWGSKKLGKILSNEGIKIEFYCMTKKDYNMQQCNGKDVIEATELNKYEDHAVIISVMVPQYREEIYEIISAFRGQIYIDLDAVIDSTGQTNLIQSLDLAIKKSWKIYLYSQKSIITSLTEEVFQIYGITINGYVYDVGDKEKGIKSIYEIAFEGIEEKLIVINEECQERLIEIRENVELAGFSLEKGNYTGLQCYTRAREIMLSEYTYCRDPLVGWSGIYPKGKPGWKIYGKEEKGIKILVLGGSTSSEEYHPENWVSKLYYKLKKRNIETTIYNGAHPGNDVVDEALRLLRDGYVLQPQIVISMSGINDAHYKDSANQFNEERLIEWCKYFSKDEEYCSGVHSDESLYSFWSRNMKLLKLISNFYGAHFLGFLQPIMEAVNHMSLRERSLYGDEMCDNIYKDFIIQSVDDGNDYVNLLQLFEHQEEMSFDACHYTDKAHEIIADKVYETLMPVIQALT